MLRCTDTTEFIVFRVPETDQQYAIPISALDILNRYHSDFDHFLYAPDDLFVEAIPIACDKRGLIHFDLENKTQILLKKLKPTWTFISK